ncbi:homeobox protein CDX-1-like isoform X2 [Portunus trituberculatus]|uniref:homeobox protein CDX-1-like isoform X2 n=1 Tax=Portunus trituberculatus TaxID=210409 RepID=UPI001E1D1B52|nr:homeobox protein CDX-1-like isoform X2 [Portunus trituberculatus]
MVQVAASFSQAAMFPTANRPPPPPAQHPMVGQQGPAGYLGYYPAQPAHHYQYPPPDFNCNLQPFVPTQFSDGLQGGPPAWHNPVYMGGHHHPAAHHAAAAHHHAVQHCQQRSPATYDDWMTPLHHNGGGASPLPQHPSLGSVGTGVHQPPHTPSPCAPGAAGPQAAPPSPTFNSYSKLPGVGGQLEYGSDGGVSGAQSPNEGVLGLAESAGDDESPPATHPQPPNAHPTPPTTLPTSTTHPPPTTHPPSSRPQQIRSPFRWIEKTAFQGPPHSDGTFLDLDGLPVKGKTRTKDKYRVVYSDHQRLELEKEFHYSRYITIRRKSELASMLGLSERQVKIWFQNRRAKERKQMKKRDELHNKEKLEVGGVGGMGGVQQYHPPSVTPIPPMHAHVPSHHHHHHHHQTGKPIIMDIKPPLGMD